MFANSVPPSNSRVMLRGGLPGRFTLLMAPWCGRITMPLGQKKGCGRRSFRAQSRGLQHRSPPPCGSGNSPGAAGNVLDTVAFTLTPLLCVPPVPIEPRGVVARHYLSVLPHAASLQDLFQHLEAFYHGGNAAVRQHLKDHFGYLFLGRTDVQRSVEVNPKFFQTLQNR